MSASYYIAHLIPLLQKIQDTQLDNIHKAAEAFAKSIAAGRAVHLFGSGHSVMPVLDIFPRYGAYVGFHPIMDPRLMWSNITGPGGAQELLWLEREEGYVKNILLSHDLDAKDCMLVFSHGGLNAAPVEMALAGKEKGMTVVVVTCGENRQYNQPTHSSGKSLHDIGDVVIDNCSPMDDALVTIEGLPGKVAASSTVTSITVAQALVAETTDILRQMGKLPERVFVSPNVTSVPKDNNRKVFEDYNKFIKSL